MFMQWMMQMMQSQMPQMMMQWMQQMMSQQGSQVSQQGGQVTVQGSQVSPPTTDVVKASDTEREPADDGEQLLTVKQVADILKVKEVTLWRMHKDGRLPRHKIGGTVVRYKKSEVEAYINSKGRDHV